MLFVQWNESKQQYANYNRIILLWICCMLKIVIEIWFIIIFSAVFSGMDAVIKFLQMFEDNYPETLKIAFVINGESRNTMFMGY